MCIRDSFWVDLTRTVLYVLIPLNLVLGVCLAAGGVISNFQPAQKAELCLLYTSRCV